MNRFIILSTDYSGFACYGFDSDGYLMEFRLCAWDITDDVKKRVLVDLGKALTFHQFRSWVHEHGLEWRKIEYDLTPEKLYRDYNMARDKKIFFDKHEALKKPMLKMQALWVHEAYERYLKRCAHDKMMPKTFINSHLYDEWDKIEVEDKKNKKR